MRRAALSIGLSVALAAATAADGRATAPVTARLDFAVSRADSPIGTHRVAFTPLGDRLQVDIEIALEVRVAFVTLYRYRHVSREIWVGDRLVALDTRTDDNGARHEVRGRATADGFAVEGTGGPVLAPADIVPTSYWREDLLRTGAMLDTQSGRLVAVTVTPVPPPPGEGRPARLYRLSGDLDSEIGYDAAGDWITLRFTASGAEIAYRRAGERAS